MKGSPIVLKDRICGSCNQQAGNSIFEALLAEPAYTDDSPSNHYATGVSQMYESCALPEWYASVQPLTALEAMADETFLLACAYNKAGERAKAITLLKKALALFPASEHYRFYLRQLQNNLQGEP
jgi:tetratricopeptide (TPR) repeat protein